jgi:hypothetical protein
MDTSVDVCSDAKPVSRAFALFVFVGASALILFGLTGCNVVERISQNLPSMTSSSATNSASVSAPAPPPEKPVKVASVQPAPDPAPAPAPVTAARRATESRPPSSVVKGAEQLATPNPAPARTIIHDLPAPAKPAVATAPATPSSPNNITVSGSLSEGLIFTGPPRKYRSPPSHRLLWIGLVLALGAGVAGFVAWFRARGGKVTFPAGPAKEALKLPRELRSKDPIGYVSDPDLSNSDSDDKGYNPAAPA